MIDFGSNLAPKIDQNWSKKWSKKWFNFWLIFWSILSTFEGFQSPKIFKNWALVYTRAQFSQFWDFGIKINFWSILGPTWLPKSTKNRSKFNQKIDLKSDWFFDCFLIDFWPIFGLFWEPSWPQNRSKIDLDPQISKLWKLSSRVDESSTFRDFSALKSFKFR